LKITKSSSVDILSFKHSNVVTSRQLCHNSMWQALRNYIGRSIRDQRLFLASSVEANAAFFTADLC